MKLQIVCIRSLGPWDVQLPDLSFLSFSLYCVLINTLSCNLAKVVDLVHLLVYSDLRCALEAILVAVPG